MTNKFDFYDIVIVKSDKKDLQIINHSEGVILGMAKNEETGRWGYAVSVYKDNDLVWDIMEEDLESTGKKAYPDTFQSDEAVKIKVHPVTGEGEISDEE